VTERVRAEDERTALLEREQQARAAAEAAIRERDEFLWVAAHELKTPVTSLRGYAQLLLRQLGTRGVLEASRARRALTILDQSAGRLAELVGQLLDVSRIESGKLVLAPRTVDLAGLVRQAAEVAQLRAAEHHFLARTPASLIACVDGLRLEQVVVNLLDNAAKFSPPGTRVWVHLASAGGTIRLTVRDQGPGIAALHLEHLFERFYQAHAGDHMTRRPGMGLGLYLSREIVQLHGGQIAVQCPRGGGSRFVVSVPAEAPPDGVGAEPPRGVWATRQRSAMLGQ
jgi:signal transduction histidine kinase